VTDKSLVVDSQRLGFPQYENLEIAESSDCTSINDEGIYLNHLGESFKMPVPKLNLNFFNT